LALGTENASRKILIFEAIGESEPAIDRGGFCWTYFFEDILIFMS